MANGSAVWGEYAFVTDTEYFDDITESIKVIKETWVLQDSEVIVFEPFPDWTEEDYEEEE